MDLYHTRHFPGTVAFKNKHPYPYRTFIAVREETGSKQAEGTAYGRQQEHLTKIKETNVSAPPECESQRAGTESGRVGCRQ